MNRLLKTVCFGVILPLAAWAVDVPQAANPDQAEAIKGNNAFAVELYGQLKSQPGNLFFSPESISTALAMTYAGTQGETAAEMGRTLHFTLPQERLHAAMEALLTDLNAAHDGYQLRVANALWGQQGYTFLDEFLKLTKENYGAGFNQVDFKGATEEARRTINQWVERQTENKIRELLQPGILTLATRLVLTDAIYFKGDWDTQFRKEETKDEDFHLSETQTVKAPLMHRKGAFQSLHAVSDNGAAFQMLEIPYKNKELSMIVLLPDAQTGLPAVEQSLTPDKMQHWLGQLRPFPNVIVTVPKFNIEARFELKDVLHTMGMKQSFEPGGEFSGMIGRRELYISAVIHNAYVDVNEEGIEAAAATAGGVNTPMGMVLSPPLIFRADHSFLFLIRDNRSGSILFMGRVNDPSK